MRKSSAALPLASLLVLFVGLDTYADGLTVCDKLRHGDDLETSVESVAFSPDGKLLVSAHTTRVGASAYISRRSGQGGTFKGAVIFWDVAKRQKLDWLDCGGVVRCVLFSPDGKLLAVAPCEVQGKPKVKIFDVGSRKELYSLFIEEPEGRTRSFSSMAFSPDSKKLVVGTTGYPQGGELIIFESETGKHHTTLKGGELTVSGLSFNADGKLLTSISENIVQIWDVASEKVRNSFSVSRGCLAVMSPDGSQIAVSTTGSRNYGGKVGIALHDANTGKELVDFKTLRTGSAHIFTPDGKNLICGLGGFIVVYDTATGKRLSISDGPNHTCLAITRKGNLIATGNYTGSVWLWEIESAK